MPTFEELCAKVAEAESAAAVAKDEHQAAYDAWSDADDAARAAWEELRAFTRDAIKAAGEEL